MKTALLVSLALSPLAFAESAIPAGFARDRYQQTFSVSPFGLATPEEKKVEEATDSPLNNLVVAGMGKLDDGREFVIVQRVGEERSMRFEGTTPNADGIVVKQVKWADHWRKSSVVLRHGSEERTVQFNQSVAPVVVPQVAAGPRVQGQGGSGQVQRGPGAATNAPPPIIPAALNPAARTGGLQRQQSGALSIPRPGGTQAGMQIRGAETGQRDQIRELRGGPERDRGDRGDRGDRRGPSSANGESSRDRGRGGR